MLRSKNNKISAKFTYIVIISRTKYLPQFYTQEYTEMHLIRDDSKEVLRTGFPGANSRWNCVYLLR